MAVHGDCQEPQNYYKDKKMNHDVKKEWKADYQKNKYQEKERYGQKKIKYPQKEKEKTHYQDKGNIQYGQTVKKEISYYGHEEQEKTYGKYGLHYVQKIPTWKYVENCQQDEAY